MYYIHWLLGTFKYGGYKRNQEGGKYLFTPVYVVMFHNNLYSSLLDCHSHAVTWWKPGLGPWPVPMGPDRWTYFWVRAAKDLHRTGPFLGRCVHGHAHWGERSFITPVFDVFCLHTVPQHLVCKLKGPSSQSADCFIIHMVLFLWGIHAGSVSSRI